ncbi:MAG TPA: diphthine--ammonia ligase [Spirochaetota bacterium]|nr:diphthine--ammonia ligase [Spirochaetota bacterium]HPQ54030.1 diphthine--ammonia ligase [Spirochaetota bacterium]
MPHKILFTWSGGKDSAMALFELQKEPDYELSALLTTITGEYDRISMHGVRRSLLEEQAASLGIPLETVTITGNAPNVEYEKNMTAALKKYRDTGISLVAFGDIFLEDLRKYREENLRKIGMDALFPLWQRDTSALAASFIDAGFRAVITAVDSTVLGGSFCGREYNRQFLSDLPPGVDPCGENGEFHSFVYDGPIFRKPVACMTGDIVFREERFYFCDLLPVRNQAPEFSEHEIPAGGGSWK